MIEQEILTQLQEDISVALVTIIDKNGSAPVLREFDMHGSGSEGDTDMICGGVQLVLIEQLTPDM